MVQPQAWSAALLGLAALLGSCREPGVVNEQQVVKNQPAPRPPVISLPRPEPPLDREALLLAVVRARSAAASGVDDRAAQARLDGARFELRMRFCNLPAEAAPPAPGPGAAQAEDAMGLRASFDAEARRVELSAAPNLVMDHPAVAAIAGEQVEDVEGFWVRHPWLLTPGCPASAPAERSVGIAQFFAADAPRSARRDGRAYEARQTLPETAPTPAGRAWELVLSGRLRPLRDGRAILCTPVPGQMPACIVAAEFERVTIEEVASGEQLAEWSRG